MAAENGDRAADDGAGTADDCSKEVCADASDSADQGEVHSVVSVFQRKRDQQEH